MMSGPLLTFSLVLGSLLVLVPQPTAGFTVKLRGGETSFGEIRVGGALDENDGVPIPDHDLTSSDDERSLNTLFDARPLPITEIDDYLMTYGYLTAPVNGSVSEKERTEAIKEFQRFARLSDTGVVDIHTKKQMLTLRCGLADPVSGSKFANFKAGSAKWKKNDLTYKIDPYTKDLPAETIKIWMAKAFKMWSDVSQLTFTEVETGPADINVRFSPLKHGDGFPFKKGGGVLGHAFYPDSGEVHIDDSKMWVVKGKKGLDMFYVLVHEIGHALGIGHSKSKTSVMVPYYRGYIPNLKLDEDDIAGIQFLYGKPVPTTKSPNTKGPFTKAPGTKSPGTKVPFTNFPSTNFPSTMRPGTKVPGTKVPFTKFPSTKGPGTKVPGTKVPFTNFPSTMRPGTEVPGTKVPFTNFPSTKGPGPKVPGTKVPFTKFPSTKGPGSKVPGTKVPFTNFPSTKGPGSKVPGTKFPFTNFPSYTATQEPGPTSEPQQPTHTFPCPYNFWAVMSVGNKTYGFVRDHIEEILPNGKTTGSRLIASVFPQGPPLVLAAAHNEETGHTFLFLGREVYRYTNQKLDEGFPKKITQFIRSAVVVDDQLIGFSFTHIHYFDEDTLEDYVDGEVTIREEYPGLPPTIKSVVSYGEDSTYLLYKNKTIKLDLYTGDWSESTC